MRPEIEPTTAPAPGFTRRRVLSGLGVLAAGAVATPLLRAAHRPPTARVEVTRRAMGTWVRIVARHRDEPAALRAIERAFAAVRTVDVTMSIHRDDTEIARVNRAAGSAAVAVSAPVLEVVGRARATAEWSGGVFDPTVLPLMHAYGFYTTGVQAPPTARAIDAALTRVDWRRVRVDAAAGTLGLEGAGMGLDLGAIGKGWAIDRAVDALRAAGATDALVDAGGKIRAYGAAEEGAEGWSVGVIHPVEHRIERTFVLRDDAIGTSGNSERFQTLGGQVIGHLFDARRGRPSDRHLSATVQARTAFDADTLCTVAFLLGPDRFRHPDARVVHFIG